MKRNKNFAAALFCVLLFGAGCSSQGVKRTCSTEVYGAKIEISYSAKSETSPIDSGSITVSIPLSMLKMAGIDTSDSQSLKDYISEQIGNDSSEQIDFDAKVNNDNVEISGKVSSDQLSDITNSSAKTFSDLSETIDKTGAFTCE